MFGINYIQNKILNMFEIVVNFFMGILKFTFYLSYFYKRIFNKLIFIIPLQKQFFSA